MIFLRSLLAFAVGYFLLFVTTWATLNLMNYCFEACGWGLAMFLQLFVLPAMFALLQAWIYLTGIISGHKERAAVLLLGICLVGESIFNIIHYFGLTIGVMPNWLYIVFELTIISSFIRAFNNIIRYNIINKPPSGLQPPM